ncbi:MAG: hypothetical protein AAF787_14215, partial [Chloroflexota bacterium]
AGTVFMLYPAVQGQLFGSHAGIIALWGTPLYIDVLYRLRRRMSIWLVVQGAVFFVFGLLGSSLLLIFMLAPVTLYFLVARWLERDWQWLRRITITVGACLLLSTVFIVPAAVEQATSDAATDPGGAVRFASDALAIVTPSFFHPAFAALDYPRQVLGTNIVEGTAYIGVVAVVLAIIALVRYRAVRGWLLVSAGAWVLSLGPLLKLLDTPVTLAVDGRATYIPLPFALVSYLPVIGTIRTPGRFNLLIGLVTAIMVGYGVAWLLNRKLPRAAQWGISGILIALIAFEYQLTWQNGLPHFPTVPAGIPAEIAALRDDDSVRAVLNLPHENLILAKEAMYLQTAHQKPIVAGFISRQTPVSTSKLSILQNTLHPTLLDEADVDIIILFRGWDETLTQHVYDSLDAPLYEDEHYAVFRVPDATEPAQFEVDVRVPDTIQARGDIHTYSAGDGWSMLSADLQADDRKLAITLDGTPLHTVTIEGQMPLRVPVPIPSGYHTLSLEPVPPCRRPSHLPDVVCRTVAAENVAMSAPVLPSLATPVDFERDIRLNSVHVQQTGAQVDVWQWWSYAQATHDNMVRFVHVVNEAGEQIAGSDEPRGGIMAGEQRVDAVTLDLPETPGIYRVYTGWYTLPDVQRLTVLGDVDGAQSNWVLLDTITVK